MVACSKWRGHLIWFDEVAQAWRYDDGSLVHETWRARPCGHCGRHSTPDDHDACLGTLPGVLNACCGHGEIGSAYLQFSDGCMIHGVAACYAIDCLRRHFAGLLAAYPST